MIPPAIIGNAIEPSAPGTENSFEACDFDVGYVRTLSLDIRWWLFHHTDFATSKMILKTRRLKTNFALFLPREEKSPWQATRDHWFKYPTAPERAGAEPAGFCPRDQYGSNLFCGGREGPTQCFPRQHRADCRRIGSGTLRPPPKRCIAPDAPRRDRDHGFDWIWKNRQNDACRNGILALSGPDSPIDSKGGSSR